MELTRCEMWTVVSDRLDILFQIMVKCGAGTQDSVNAASYLDVMHTYNIALDKKEISKINKARLHIIIAFMCQDQVTSFEHRTISCFNNF